MELSNGDLYLFCRFSKLAFVQGSHGILYWTFERRLFSVNIDALPWVFIVEVLQYEYINILLVKLN